MVEKESAPTRRKSVVKTKTGVQSVLSEEDKDDIVAKKKAGKTVDELAREYGRGVHCIRRVLVERKVKTQKGVPPRGFTDAEREKIIRLSGGGVAREEIARIMGRGILAVNLLIREHHKKIQQSNITLALTDQQRANVITLVEGGYSPKQITVMIGQEIERLVEEHQQKVQRPGGEEEAQ